MPIQLDKVVCTGISAEARFQDQNVSLVERDGSGKRKYRSCNAKYARSFFGEKEFPSKIQYTKMAVRHSNFHIARARKLPDCLREILEDYSAVIGAALLRPQDVLIRHTKAEYR